MARDVVHLRRDWDDVDHPACNISGGYGLYTTDDPDQVTCKRCLKIINPEWTDVEKIIPRQVVFDAISRERDYQEQQAFSPHDIPGWLLILEAELAEAKHAWVKGDGDRDALREILQVAAVAVACLEWHGVVER